MKVSDVMTSDVVTVAPAMTLKQAAALLSERNIGGVPVVEGEEIVGVLSETDLLFKERGPSSSERLVDRLFSGEGEAEAAKVAAETVGEAMTAPPVTIDHWEPVAAAAGKMLAAGVNRLPVVKEGKLVGIVTRHDLVRAFSRPDHAIEYEIRYDVVAGTFGLHPASVGIDVHDGKVKLRGHVDTPLAVELIPAVARRVPGVVSVDARLSAPDRH
jgi:CBS domain-containing protein